MSLRYTVPVEDVPPAALAHENSVYSQLSDLAAEKLRESNYLSHLYVKELSGISQYFNYTRLMILTLRAHLKL